MHIFHLSDLRLATIGLAGKQKFINLDASRSISFNMKTFSDYCRIEKAIKYLLQNYRDQPSLEDVAAQVHISPFHFQRIFSEWAGISPKKFLQYITIESLKKQLDSGKNLIEIADSAGLSSQSRIYDLFVQIEGVTPDEYRKSGKGISIGYGIHPTPFGHCFIAVTERGICSMAFTDRNEDDLLSELNQQWVNANIHREQRQTGLTVRNIFIKKSRQELRLLLKGTKFQIKVWEALLKIPFGSVTNYMAISEMIGNPGSTRAVATAIANNPVAYLIPCHRVIRREGIIGEYHWGKARKAAMIGWEKAQFEAH